MPLIGDLGKAVGILFVARRGTGEASGSSRCGGTVARLEDRRAFCTLVPIRPRRRGERRSLRTFPGVSLRPHLAFNPRPRRLSTLTDAFQLHPDIRSYGTALRRTIRKTIWRRGAREARVERAAGDVRVGAVLDEGYRRARGGGDEREGGGGARGAPTSAATPRGKTKIMHFASTSHT